MIDVNGSTGKGIIRGAPPDGLPGSAFQALPGSGRDERLPMSVDLGASVAGSLTQSRLGIFGLNRGRQVSFTFFFGIGQQLSLFQFVGCSLFGRRARSDRDVDLCFLVCGLSARVNSKHAKGDC